MRVPASSTTDGSAHNLRLIASCTKRAAGRVRTAFLHFDSITAEAWSAGVSGAESRPGIVVVGHQLPTGVLRSTTVCAPNMSTDWTRLAAGNAGAR
jgi:hypothetical protein